MSPTSRSFALALLTSVATLGAFVSSEALATAPYGASGSSSPEPSLDVSGVWVGSYVCTQGKTGLRLVLTATSSDRVEGRFEFFALDENPGVPSGSFRVTGSLSGSTLTLKPNGWISRPPGYLEVALAGSISADGDWYLGHIQHAGCDEFAVSRSSAGVALDLGPPGLPARASSQPWGRVPSAR